MPPCIKLQCEVWPVPVYWYLTLGMHAQGGFIVGSVSQSFSLLVNISLHEWAKLTAYSVTCKYKNICGSCLIWLRSRVTVAWNTSEKPIMLIILAYPQSAFSAQCTEIVNDIQPCLKGCLLVQLACVGVTTDRPNSRSAQFMHMHIGVYLVCMCSEGFALSATHCMHTVLRVWHFSSFYFHIQGHGTFPIIIAA